MGDDINTSNEHLYAVARKAWDESPKVPHEWDDEDGHHSHLASPTINERLRTVVDRIVAHFEETP